MEADSSRLNERLGIGFLAGLAAGSWVGVLDAGMVIQATGYWWYGATEIGLALLSYAVVGAVLGGALAVLHPVFGGRKGFRRIAFVVLVLGGVIVSSVHAFDVVLSFAERTNPLPYAQAAAPVLATAAVLYAVLATLDRIVRIPAWILSLAMVGLGAATPPFLLRAQATHEANVASAHAKAPDILLLVMDTTRKDSLSLSDPKGSTPALADVAAESIVYDRAYAPGTWTSISHASLFTGTYASVHGTYSLRTALGKDLTTLSEAMSEFGYRTGFISPKDLMTRSDGWTRGFDESVSFNREDRVHLVWQRLLTRFLFGSGDDTRAEVQMAIRWMEDARRSEEPFFLFLNVNDPHAPYDARDDEPAEHLASGRLTSDERVQLQKLARGQRFHSDTTAVPERVGRALHAFYDSEIAAMDRALAPLFDYFRNADPERPAVMIVVSDHGELLGEHDRTGHGMLPYEELVNVPFVLWTRPSLGRGVRRELVSLVDVFPTLVGMAGADPALYDQIQGRDLLRGPEPESVFVEHWTKPGQITVPPGYRVAAVGRDSKYIWESDVPDSWFDLDRDRAERDNVLDRHAEEARILREQIRSILGIEPAAQSGAADVGEAHRKRLEALGYLR